MEADRTLVRFIQVACQSSEASAHVQQTHVPPLQVKIINHKYSQESRVLCVSFCANPNGATFVEASASFQTLHFLATHTFTPFCLSLSCLF